MQGFERLRIGEIIAIVMGDGDIDNLALIVSRSKSSAVIFHPEEYFAAKEQQPGVAHERAGQQSRLGEDLKAVADAKGKPAALRMRDDFAHNGGMCRHRARTQIIAVGKTA